LSVLSSWTQPCGAHQNLYYLDPQGSGTAFCSFPTQGQFTTGGFVSGDPFAGPQISLPTTFTNVANEQITYAGGTEKYLVQAVVELESSSSQVAFCSLVDTTTNTTIESEGYNVDGYGNLSLLATPSIADQDNLAVKCESTGTTSAQATLASIPLG